MDTDTSLAAELRRHNLLIPLLQRQIIAEAVINEHISEEEIASAQKNFMNNQNLKGREDLQKHLVKRGWRENDFEWQISLPIRIHKHCLKHYRHKAEAKFLNRKNQLDQVVYSLLRVRDQFLAKELFWRIKSKECSFGDLASQYAEGPESNTNGIVGPVPLSQAHPILAEALRVTKPGVLMEPIQINEWCIVARVESYKPATFDETMAARLSQELFDQWVDEEVATRIRRDFEVGTSPNGE